MTTFPPYPCQKKTEGGQVASFACSHGPGKMSAAQFKNFLYAFCGKRKTRPVYTERPSSQGTFKFQVNIQRTLNLLAFLKLFFL